MLGNNNRTPVGKIEDVEKLIVVLLVHNLAKSISIESWNLSLLESVASLLRIPCVYNFLFLYVELLVVDCLIGSLALWYEESVNVDVVVVVNTEDCINEDEFLVLYVEC